jgi:hypothetical protein
MVLALKGARGGIARRGAKVCGKSLGGHCDGGGWLKLVLISLGEKKNQGKSGLKGNVASFSNNRRKRRRGSPQLVDQFGSQVMDVDKLPSLATEGQLG